MNNEEKILELLMGMQKDIVGLKQGQQRLESRQESLEIGQQRLESRQESLEKGQQRIEAKVDKLATTQSQDIFNVMQLTYHKVDQIHSKFDLLNKRLFDQEAELQTLKRVK